MILATGLVFGAETSSDRRIVCRYLDDSTRKTPREFRPKPLPSRGLRPAETPNPERLVSQWVPGVTSQSLQVRFGVAPDSAPTPYDPPTHSRKLTGTIDFANQSNISRTNPTRMWVAARLVTQNREHANHASHRCATNGHPNWSQGTASNTHAGTIPLGRIPTPHLLVLCFQSVGGRCRSPPIGAQDGSRRRQWLRTRTSRCRYAWLTLRGNMHVFGSRCSRGRPPIAF